MAAGSDQTDGEAQPTEADLRLQRWLKIAIAVMGIMIVAALLAIAYRILNPAAGKAPRTTVSVAAPAASSDIALPSGASVKTMTLEGDRLVLYYEAPSGGGIVVVDVASGKTVSRLRLTPETPR